MREAEIAARNRDYIKKLPIRKNILFAGYIVIAAIFAATLLTKNKLLLFLFLASFSAFVNYHINLQSIRFNIDPEVSAGLIIASIMGFNSALLLFFIAETAISVYTARMDKDTLISGLITIGIYFLASNFFFINFVAFSIILITLRFILGLVINMLIDISPHEIIFEHVLGFGSNILFMLTAGSFLYSIFA